MQNFSNWGERSLRIVLLCIQFSDAFDQQVALSRTATPIPINSNNNRCRHLPHLPCTYVCTYICVFKYIRQAFEI